MFRTSFEKHHTQMHTETNIPAVTEAYSCMSDRV